MGPDAATAFVPGHATLVFAPYGDEDPAVAGSTGAGLTLSDGVTVSARRAEAHRVRLGGDPVTVEAVDRVLGGLPEPVQVDVTTRLPIGAGFGVSGAMALGTALATNRVLGLARSENELVAEAHRADVEAGTGLGDVVSQARGGVPIRVRPGDPDHGSLDGVPATGRLEYCSFGDLDTAAVLAGDLEAIRDAGEAALEVVRQRPTLDSLFESSRRFARAAGLLTPRVEEAVGAVRDDGGEAAMVMLGESVIGLGTGLSDAGYEPNVCRVRPSGATMRT